MLLPEKAQSCTEFVYILPFDNFFSSKIWFGNSDSIAYLFMEKTLKYTGLLGKPKKEGFFASEMGICRSCVFSGRLNFKISNNVLKIIYEGAITFFHEKLNFSFQ